MQTLIKEQTEPVLTIAAIGKDWDLLPPFSPEKPGIIHDARHALMQAESVIRAQEERIRTLEHLALTDELTGLANRRGFMAAFERELALARRDLDYNGMLVMIDLDSFKAINDKWGHPAGDAYLRTVANVLRDSVRASDIVARLGGDEFALLLTHIDEKAGSRRIARLEQAFGKQTMMLQERMPLRASFGCAPYSGSDTVERVVQSADARLYVNKSRNRKLIAAG